jgi:Flp pilus assembly protein TadD
MAADSLTGLTQCPVCRAKLSANRTRSPRCRARLSPDQQWGLQRGVRQGGAWPVLGVSALVLVGFAVLWPGARSSVDIVKAAAISAPLVRQAQPVSIDEGPPRPTQSQMVVHPSDAAWRGAEAFRRGDYAAALAAYVLAIAAQPDDAESLNNAALALERLGRFGEALPLLRRAVEINPQKWSYRFNLGHVRGRMEDWSGAVEEYREADRLFPDDHVTLFNLGLALQRQGKDSEAIGPLSRASQLEPGDPSLLLALGKSYQRLERTDEFKATLRRFIHLAPDSPVAPTVRGVLETLEARALAGKPTEVP